MCVWVGGGARTVDDMDECVCVCVRARAPRETYVGVGAVEGGDDET